MLYVTGLYRWCAYCVVAMGHIKLGKLCIILYNNTWSTFMVDQLEVVCALVHCSYAR